MNADTAPLAEADLTERVIGLFYAVYNELGHGFLESVYENSLALALAIREAGIAVVQQAPLRVDFLGHTVGEFRADLLVDGRLIVEIKAVSRLAAAHESSTIRRRQASVSGY